MYNNIGDTMKDNKIDDILILKDYNEISKLTTEEILTKYHTKEEGLTNKEAQKRLNNNVLLQYLFYYLLLILLLQKYYPQHFLYH